MKLWSDEKQGRTFLPGRNAPELAEQAALICSLFRRDDEEECFAEEPVTCYNCRYRRWTADSFTCMRSDMT